MGNRAEKSFSGWRPENSGFIAGRDRTSPGVLEGYDKRNPFANIVHKLTPDVSTCEF